MELEKFNAPSFRTGERKPIGFLPPVTYVAKHVIYLMDPRSGSVQKVPYGPDMRLGAKEEV